MVINTPAARSMDWAAGFQREIVFILRVFKCTRPSRRFAGRLFLCLKVN